MTEKLVLSALVDNHSGVLLRVAGLFARRGYNIASLTVCETEDPRFSRMTIVAQAEPFTFRQIEKQLLKVEDVWKVVRLDEENASSSELLLVKVKTVNGDRAEVLQIVLAFGARVMDIGDNTITIELTGQSQKLDRFVEALQEHGICELARTGITALERGDDTIKKDLEV